MKFRSALPVFIVLAMSGSQANAQDFDGKPGALPNWQSKS